MASDQGIGSWVPQLFFDLIGRVVPGIIVLSSVYVAHVGLKEAYITAKTVAPECRGEDFPTILFLLGLTLAAYLAAHLFQGMSYLLVHVAKALDSLFPKWRWWTWPVKCFSRPVRRFDLHPDRRQDFWRRYDYIKLKDPSAGSRMAKVNAERNMCDVLHAGWLFCLVWAIVVHWGVLKAHTGLFCVLVGAIAFMGAVRLHLDSILESGVINYSELMEYRTAD